MNFKFSKGKVIWSIFIAALIDLIFVIFGINCYIIDGYVGPKLKMTCPIENQLVVFLISLILIYIIWSLFQKRSD